MSNYKHFENDAIRMTIADGNEELKKDLDKGIKIKTEYGEFIFMPTCMISDHAGDPIIYFKFNHREKLVLYHMTQHPDGMNAFTSLRNVVDIANRTIKEGYIVRDIMDYIKETEKVVKKLKDGDIELKDDIHPDMKYAFDEK